MAAKNDNQTLIIAIGVVVLLVIVYGIYILARGSGTTAPGGGGGPFGGLSPCSGAQGFACMSPSYNYSSGKMLVTIEQNTGSNWSVATIAFVPAGTSYTGGVPVISWGNGTVLNNGLRANTLTIVSLKVPGAPTSGAISGTIWAQYQLLTGGTTRYVEVATVNSLV